MLSGDFVTRVLERLKKQMWSAKVTQRLVTSQSNYHLQGRRKEREEVSPESSEELLLGRC